MSRRAGLQWYVGFAVSLILLLPNLACNLTDNLGPTVTFKQHDGGVVVVLPRRGALADLVVLGGSTVMWRVVPETQLPPGSDQIKEVLYGVVPAGYRQVVPGDGKSPALLTPWNRYTCLVVVREPRAGPQAYMENFGVTD
jgi:hypothetical protein